MKKSLITSFSEIALRALRGTVWKSSRRRVVAYRRNGAWVYVFDSQQVTTYKQGPGVCPGTTDFTVGMVVYPQGSPGQILASHYDTGLSQGWQIQRAPGGFQVFVGTLASPIIPLAPAVFNALVFTYQELTGTGYLIVWCNGMQYPIASGPQLFLPSSTPFQLGDSNVGIQSDINGLVYNERSLTAAEVAAWFSATKGFRTTQPIPDTVHRWDAATTATLLGNTIPPRPSPNILQASSGPTFLNAIPTQPPQGIFVDFIQTDFAY